MELSAELRELFIGTGQALKGHARRVFQATVVQLLGEGGQRQAVHDFGWNRGTIRKGEHERSTGVECVDAFSARGAKPVEARLPHLHEDIKDILKGQCRTDPRFRTTRIYRRLSVQQILVRLVEDKGYTPEQVPCNETIRKLLPKLGFERRTVQKVVPKKRSQKPTPSSTRSTK